MKYLRVVVVYQVAAGSDVPPADMQLLRDEIRMGLCEPPDGFTADQAGYAVDVLDNLSAPLAVEWLDPTTKDEALPRPAFKLERSNN